MNKRWKLVWVVALSAFVGAIIGACVMLGCSLYAARLEGNRARLRRADIRWSEIHRPGRLAEYRRHHPD